jgi:FkbM family methyltransferase
MIAKLKRALRAAIEAQGYLVRPTSQFGLSLGEDLRRLLRGRDAPRVLDVGANSGQWLTSIKHTFPRAWVHCYEPDERAFTQLRAKAQQFGQVQCLQYALGREPGTMKFFRNADSVTSSLLQPAKQVRALPYAEKLTPFDSVEVEVRTVAGELDRLNLSRLDLLKTDCQGFDLGVLEGAERAINDGRIELISTEALFHAEYEGQAWFYEILDWLRPRGFALIGIYDILHDDSGRALFGDALFAHEESAARRARDGQTGAGPSPYSRIWL